VSCSPVAVAADQAAVARPAMAISSSRRRTPPTTITMAAGSASMPTACWSSAPVMAAAAVTRMATARTKCPARKDIAD